MRTHFASTLYIHLIFPNFSLLVYTGFLKSTGTPPYIFKGLIYQYHTPTKHITVFYFIWFLWGMKIFLRILKRGSFNTNPYL